MKFENNWEINGMKNQATVSGSCCFPGDAIVRTVGGVQKRMCNVTIGDAIWDGEQFTDVFMLSRADPAASGYM